MLNKDTTYRRVLVFTNGETIGDGFIKIHFIKALRDAYPKAEIYWHTSKPSVFTAGLKQISDAFLDKVFEQTSIVQLWKYNFDLIIDTQDIFAQSLRLKLLRHHKMVSRTSNYIFSSYKPPKGEELPKHDVKKLMTLVSLAGISLSLVKEKLPLPLEYREKAAELLPVNQKYIGLIAGAGRPDKCWPLKNFIELAYSIVNLGYIPVFILGPQEQTWVPKIHQEVSEALFPLQDPRALASHLFTVAIGERLDAAIANDGGVGHMMSVAEVPLISLFAKTDAERYSPIVQKGYVVRSQEYASDEMGAIPVAEVSKLLVRLLSEL